MTFAPGPGGYPKVHSDPGFAIVYLRGATFFILLQLHFLEALKAGGLDLGKPHFQLTYKGLTYHSIEAQIYDDHGHKLTALFDWAAKQNDPAAFGSSP